MQKQPYALKNDQKRDRRHLVSQSLVKKDVSSKARLDSSLDLQGCALSMSNSIQSSETRKVTNVLSLSLCQMAFYNPSKLGGTELVCLWSSLLPMTVENVSYLNF